MKEKDQLADEIIVLTDHFLQHKCLATISGDACMAAATAVILHLDYLAENVLGKGEEGEDDDL